MAAIRVAVRASPDGTLTIPREAVKSLGLDPGDEADLSVENRNGFHEATNYDLVMDRLFEEVDNLVPEPGRPPSDPLKAIWGVGVEEKFAKMGITV